MLLRTLFLLGGAATLVSAMAAGAQCAAHVILQRTALAAMRSAYQRQIARMQADLAEASASGSQPADIAAASVCAAAGANGRCAIAVESSWTFAPAAGGGVLQGNDVVSEGRVTATLAVRALGPANDVLGARTMRVAFRTLRVPPWALPDGDLDASFDAARNDNAPGDDGGQTPSASSPGTLIDVMYRNAATGAEMPANVWRTQTPAPGAGAPWSP